MNRRRRGYVILELLLVISSLVVVLGLCVGLIHSLLRLDRVARDHLAETTARDRLARQFRRDVRAASRSSLKAGAAPAPKLELTGPGGRIVEYAPGDGRVIRSERDGDRQVGREDYRLPSRPVTGFRSLEEDGAPFVVLSLRRKADASTAGRAREAEYQAMLGRDARHARRQGGAP